MFVDHLNKLLLLITNWEAQLFRLIYGILFIL